MVGSRSRGLNLCIVSGSDERAVARLFVRDPTSGALSSTEKAASVPSASFVAEHPSGSHLYVSSETESGSVTALRMHGGSLAASSHCPTGGADPCFVDVDPAGQFLVVTNYEGGNVALVRLTSDGELAGACDLVAGEGAGPERARQGGPHPHCARFLSGGRRVVVADLGSDRLRSYAVDATAGRLRPLATACLPPGSGPRHFVAGAGVLYVTAELSSSLVAIAFDERVGVFGDVSHVVPASTAPAIERNYPSDLLLHGEGERLLVALNRGAHTIALFDLGHATAAPRLVGEIPAHGRWPVHMAEVGRHLYVANQHSDEVVCLGFDGQGSLRRLGTLEVESPVCVLALAGFG